MVRNHVEEKRQKARMVINYKKNLTIILSLMAIIFLIKEFFLIEFKEHLGCKSGYWKIKMDEESIPVTAFSAPQGHYEWIVMPFGLKNVPQIFQKRMNDIFKDLNYCYLAYVDDIFVFSKTIE